MSTRTSRTVLHTIIYFAGLVGSRGLAVVLVPVYTRVLTPSSFALWDLCMTTVLFLNPLFNLGMQSALLRYYYHYDTEHARRRVYSTAVWFLIGLILPGLILIALAAPAISRNLFKVPDAGHLVVLVALLSALGALSQQPLSLLRAWERSGLFSTLQVIRGLVAPAAIILLVLVFQAGVAGILLGEITGFAALGVAGFWITRRWLRPALDAPALRAMLAYGLPLLPMGIGGALLAVSDRYILRMHLSLEEMAPYSLGFKVGMALSLLIQALQLSWQPAALQLDKQPGGRRAIASNLLILSFGLFAAATAVACFAPELAWIFAPAQGYDGADWVIPWIALSYAIHGLVYLLTAGFGIAKKTAWASLIFCVAGAAKVILSLVFIPQYGIAAAAVTTLIGFLLELALTYILVQRIYPIPIHRFRFLLPLLLSGAVLATVLLSLSWSYPLSLATRILVLAAFLAACYTLGLTPHQRRALWQTAARYTQKLRPNRSA